MIHYWTKKAILSKGNTWKDSVYVESLLQAKVL